MVTCARRAVTRPLETRGARVKEPPLGTVQALYAIDKQKQLACTVGGEILEAENAVGPRLSEKS